MAKLTLMGDGSGSIDLVVPAAAGTHTITLPSVTGNVLVSTVTMNFPTTLGTNGQFLKTDGAGTLSWSNVGAGSVTSVDASGGTTGLSFSGGPITGAGTLTLGGTLGTSNGGTGLNALGAGVVAALGNAANGPSGIAVMNGAGVLAVVDGGTGLSALGTNVQTALGNNANAANGLAVLNGSGALTVANGGTGLTSLGTAGQVLKVNPGVTAAIWANESDILNVGSTSITSGSSGGVLYQSGTTLNEVAIGLAGQVLTVNPGGTAPIWATPGSGSAQSANEFFAGPVSGGAAVPTFRAIAYGDMQSSFAAAQNLSASGYQLLPGGVIMQWGTGNTGAGTVTVNFPTPFATACQFTATPHDNAGTNAVLTSGNKTTTSVDVTTTVGNTGLPLGSCDFDWIAIGY